MEQLDLYALMEEDQHDPQIQYKLGVCYLHGFGTPKDPAQAEIWLKRAAEQGHSEAAALLGEASREETGEAITPDTLPRWCLRAEDGDMEAQYAVACYYMQQDARTHSREIDHYLKEAAQQGHGNACLLLGRQLLEAEACEEAVLYLNRACECNLSQAAELLSSCCYNGTGVEKDPEKAEQLLQRAGDWGDAEANFRIALRYAQGKDIPANQVKAMAFLAKAQLSGMENAQQRFDAQLEAYRQAEEAKQERLRRQEEERIRTEQQARLRRQQQEEAAAQKAREEKLAREKWEKQHVQPLKAAVQTGQEALALAKLKNCLRPHPITGLLAGLGVFWLARVLHATQTQAMLLGIGFAIAAAAILTAIGKKIKPVDTRTLEREVAHAQAQLDQWEKEGRA